MAIEYTVRFMKAYIVAGRTLQMTKTEEREKNQQQQMISRESIPEFEAHT